MRAASWMASLVVIALASVAAGCGGSTRTEAPGVVGGSDISFVRFINGSAGAGSVTPVTTSSSVPALAFGAVSPFSTVPAGQQTFEFSVAGRPTFTCTTPLALTDGAYYTVVLAGSTSGTGSTGLQCQLFLEVYEIQTGQSAQLLFHNAAPLLNEAGTSTLSISLSGAGTVSGQLLGDAAFSTTLQTNCAVGTPVNATFVGVTTGSGVSFVVGPGSTSAAATGGAEVSPSSLPSPTPSPTPISSTGPGQAVLGSGNPGALPDPFNWFPIASSDTISIYAVDSPGTPPITLITVID